MIPLIARRRNDRIVIGDVVLAVVEIRKGEVELGISGRNGAEVRLDEGNLDLGARREKELRVITSLT
jgi:hypothetical protein